MRSSKRILILTGAGISELLLLFKRALIVVGRRKLWYTRLDVIRFFLASLTFSDFRSRNGVYASLGQYELDDPQQMYIVIPLPGRTSNRTTGSI